MRSDLDDMPRLLADVANEWNDPGSGNRATAEAFFNQLYAVHEVSPDRTTSRDLRGVGAGWGQGAVS